MLKLQKIAVTGSIASGKSSVCRFFQDLGAYVVSADAIVHQLLSLHTSIGRQVVALMGEEIVENGSISRAKIAAKVFTPNSQLLGPLESLLHPQVMLQIEQEYQKVQGDEAVPLFVAEVPLLFEIKGAALFDQVIAVVADESRCQQRFIAKTQLEPTDYSQRMARQMTGWQKEQLADITLRNDGSLLQLKKEVQALFEKLRLSALFPDKKKK